MKKIIGIIVIILMIPVIISIIGDIDRTPVYPTTEFNIIDKPYDKQLLSNDKLLYQLPNTVNFTINELPEYVEYYEYGILEVDSGILNYTINDNLAYINYIEAELSQVINGELIVSKPTQIISKSSNLLPYSVGSISKFGITVTIDEMGNITIDGTVTANYLWIKLTGGLDIISGMPNPNNASSWISDNNIFNSGTYTTRKEVISGTTTTSNFYLNSFDKNFNRIDISGLTSTDLTTTINHDTNFIAIYIGSSGTYTNYTVRYGINAGTTALPYQPFVEHIYNLDNGVELYKLPNGVGDKWYQNGTLERNVGVIDTVNNYAEYGTLPQGTYDNVIEFINNNQNKQIKLFFNDNIQESRYNTYLENDTIIINNDSEVIRIYNNDTYTSTRNLDIDITYKLVGYHIIDYIDGEFDNTVLAFFWIIPVLLVGGLIYLLLKRKE